MISTLSTMTMEKPKASMGKHTMTKMSIKSTVTNNPKIEQTIETLSQRLTKGDAISQFNPYEITNGLRSFYILQYFQRDFMKVYMKRLRKQPIRYKMSPRDICSCIWYIGQLMEVLSLRQEEMVDGFQLQTRDLLEEGNFAFVLATIVYLY